MKTPSAPPQSTAHNCYVKYEQVHIFPESQNDQGARSTFLLFSRPFCLFHFKEFMSKFMRLTFEKGQQTLRSQPDLH